MHRTEVTSSQIHSIGFDPENKVLEIQFKKADAPGPVYRYFDVEPEKHAALMGADSIGRHFNANFRKGHRFEKVEPEPPAEAGQSAA